MRNVLRAAGTLMLCFGLAIVLSSITNANPPAISVTHYEIAGAGVGTDPFYSASIGTSTDTEILLNGSLYTLQAGVNEEANIFAADGNHFHVWTDLQDPYWTVLIGFGIDITIDVVGHYVHSTTDYGAEVSSNLAVYDANNIEFGSPSDKTTELYKENDVHGHTDAKGWSAGTEESEFNFDYAMDVGIEAKTDRADITLDLDGFSYIYQGSVILWDGMDAVALIVLK
jgi:hypothetical protein